MFLRVTHVQHLGGYRLRLEFSNGVLKDVDLSSEVYGEVFEPLRVVRLFAQVALNPETGTVEWPNGADFAPEFLHDLGGDAQQVA